MKSKKFNTHEVQAIIAGNKTMFREVCKIQPGKGYYFPSGKWKFEVGQEIFVEGQEPPIALKIKSVKVERLQDISGKDCEKEGIGYTGGWNEEDYDDGEYYFGKLTESEEGIIEHTTEMFQFCDRFACKNEMFEYAEHAFEAYWNSMQKKQEHEWKANPWVFVYEFEVINFKK